MAGTFDRRSFIKAVAGGAGVTALATVTQSRAASAAALGWDHSYDVVVVGYGGAGAAAAITAHDAGARVLIIEKGPRGGGSTYYSGGYFVSPTDAEAAADYLMACSKAAEGQHFDVSRADFVAWAKEASGNAAWFRELGGDPIRMAHGWYSDAPGAESFATFQPESAPHGVGIWKVLEAAVAARDIDILHEAPGKELVTGPIADEGGAEGVAVVGIIAQTAQGPLRIEARKGVILTCGGFDYDETLKKSYLRVYPHYSVGHPGNTGDAIALTAKVNAALWRLTATPANVCHKFPEVPVAYPSLIQIFPDTYSFVMVNAQGRRFIDETLNYDAVGKSMENYDPASRSFAGDGAWLIFDEKTRRQGPVSFPLPIGDPAYHWSEDNQAEIDKGWIIKADSIADLAGALGLDAATLTATIDTYNSDCAAGRDSQHGRERGLIALDTGPYYGLRSYPGLWSTGGGPRIDRFARVIDVSGNVVPHLYVAGAASPFSLAHLYPVSGTAIADCFAMGRIAARMASREVHVRPGVD